MRTAETLDRLIDITNYRLINAVCVDSLFIKLCICLIDYYFNDFTVLLVILQTPRVREIESFSSQIRVDRHITLNTRNICTYTFHLEFKTVKYWRSQMPDHEDKRPLFLKHTVCFPVLHRFISVGREFQDYETVLASWMHSVHTTYANYNQGPALNR
jgi:hypothetical protein